MPESLKAARERVAKELVEDAMRSGFSRIEWVEEAYPDWLKSIAAQSRELQRQAMEAVLAHIGRIEFEPTLEAACRAMAKVIKGSDKSITLDALLDGPAPGERERQAALESRGWSGVSGGEDDGR